jgi:hypothetical protein
VLAISGQHVAVLAAVIYFALRAFAVPAATCMLTTLALIWVYILVAGAPPSAIRAGVVATLVLVAGLLGRQFSPPALYELTTPHACDSPPHLVRSRRSRWGCSSGWLGARALLIRPCAIGVLGSCPYSPTGRRRGEKDVASCVRRPPWPCAAQKERE